jgi:hypothetical protein
MRASCWLARRLRPAAVAADRVRSPTDLQPLRERRDRGRCIRIVWGLAHEHADSPHPLARLLRARRERPRGRGAQQRDELASRADTMFMPLRNAIAVATVLVETLKAPYRTVGKPTKSKAWVNQIEVPSK